MEKIFVVTLHVSDDDGNSYTEVLGAFTDRSKAEACLNDAHDTHIANFTDPDDDYDESNFFDICEEDDITIRVIGEIHEVELN